MSVDYNLQKIYLGCWEGKKMQRCLTCENVDYKLIKTIGKAHILECPNCSLAFTDNVTSTKQKLYGKSGPYSFAGYKNNEDNQIKRIERFIEAIRSLVLSGRVLDVGGGYGLFSKELAVHSEYTIDCLEPNLSVRYIDGEKNIKVLKKSFESFAKKTKKKYDLITFIDVLEHFHNPDEIIVQAKKLLTKKGHLFIVAPNYQSLMAKLCKNWAWWMVEDHYYHFSPKSLRSLLLNNGFRIEYATTFETFLDFKKNLDGNYLRRRNDYWLKIKKILSEALTLAGYLITRPILWSFQKGGLILMIAKKNGKS